MHKLNVKSLAKSSAIFLAIFASGCVCSVSERPTPSPQAATPESRAATGTSRSLRNVNLSADFLFDFDKVVVKPSGKQEIDALVADLKGVDFDQILVTGHTDRLGSHAYNLKLSSRRANAVKAYLMESAGIPADRIVAKGIDGANPVTKPGECVGTKRTKALIACLQPDRRVEIEVTGKK